MAEYKSFANKKFWNCYNELPDGIQQIADKAYQLFKKIPNTQVFILKK